MNMFSSQVLVLDCFVSDFCRVSITIHEKACAITCNKIVHEIDNKVSEVPDIIFLYFFLLHKDFDYLFILFRGQHACFWHIDCFLTFL